MRPIHGFCQITVLGPFSFCALRPNKHTHRYRTQNSHAHIQTRKIAHQLVTTSMK